MDVVSRDRKSAIVAFHLISLIDSGAQYTSGPVKSFTSTLPFPFAKVKLIVLIIPPAGSGGGMHSDTHVIRLTAPRTATICFGSTGLVVLAIAQFHV